MCRLKVFFQGQFDPVAVEQVKGLEYFDFEKISVEGDFVKKRKRKQNTLVCR